MGEAEENAQRRDQECQACNDCIWWCHHSGCPHSSSLPLALLSEHRHLCSLGQSLFFVQKSA